MVEVHIFGATSRIGRSIVASLERVSTREDGVTVGYVSREQWISVNAKRKVLIFLAWAGYPSDSIAGTAEKTNKEIVGAALRLATREKYDQIVFTSSAGALYREDGLMMHNEESATYCTTSYGMQKISAERELRKFCDKSEVRLAILRVTTAYGFTDSIKRQGAISRWIDSVVNGKEIELWISRDSTVNFISYEQVADAIFRTIHARFDGILNIGCSDAHRINNILDKIDEQAEKYGIQMRVKQENSLLRTMSVDCAKSVRVLGKQYKSTLLHEISALFEKMVMRKTGS